MLVVDASGHIVDVNRQLERLFGYAREALVGQPIELLVDGLPDVHRQRREQYQAAPQTRPMGAGRDLFGRHHDGHRVPVEIGLTPLRVRAEAFVVASIVDLSERKRADEQFRLAMEAAPNGMMLVDASGRIVRVNAQIEALFKESRAELVGRQLDELIPARFRAGHASKRQAYFTAPSARPMGAGRELFALRRDGSEVPVEIGLSPIQTADGELVLASIVDITERRLAREALQASLAEKDVLLRELHHRAKNNLQLIASLLDLSSGQPSADALTQCQSRVQAISLVHERLYQSGTFTRIDMKEYVEAIAPQLAQAWGGAQPVTLKLETEQVYLGLDAAIPCGLVLNELVTNAFKHAFPNGRAGTITVRVLAEGTRVTVAVLDDGVGFDATAKRPGHIGLELMNALTRQLRGTLRFVSGGGSAITLTFDRST
ncbi:MAG: PAS domain S-box protein [Archangiaceae bacterium]|nr:PAS domain S-box protein [Archangiaceae bacterium]